MPQKLIPPRLLPDIYPLTDEMLSFKMEKQSYVKCQILAVTVDTGILRRLGTIKERYFNEIVDKIVDSIF